MNLTLGFPYNEPDPRISRISFVRSWICSFRFSRHYLLLHWTSPAWAPVVGGGLVVTAAVLQIYSTYETYKSIEDLSENEAIKKFKEHCKERDDDLRELDNFLKDQNNGF